MISYYLTLISGANQIDFDNTSSKFRNKLPLAIDFQKETEFGICEISYVPYINNIPLIEKGLSVFDFLWTWDETNGEKAGMYGKPFDIDIGEGYYANELILCQYLNESIWNVVPRLQGKIIISYNECKRRFKVDVESHFLTILFKPKLGSILGMNNFENPSTTPHCIGKSHTLGDSLVYNNENHILNASASWVAESSGFQPYLSNLIFTETLFIYCDLVFQQYSAIPFSYHKHV